MVDHHERMGVYAASSFVSSSAVRGEPNQLILYVNRWLDRVKDRPRVSQSERDSWKHQRESWKQRLPFDSLFNCFVGNAFSTRIPHALWSNARWKLAHFLSLVFSLPRRPFPGRLLRNAEICVVGRKVLSHSIVHLHLVATLRGQVSELTIRTPAIPNQISL